MTTHDLATMDLSIRPILPVDAISMARQPISAASVQPLFDAPRATSLDEPTSSTLMVIGMMTLVAYRGIVKRLGGQPAVRAAPLIKPRRRAA